MVKLVIIRQLSTAVKSIRNVGIIAHIDAGKTTVTERMLFDAGKIKHTGEVDKGTTVTDYLDEERKRGITISSATATLKWQDSWQGNHNTHSINLIDTPGHVDFTGEVERALSVLDGAVTILDGTKGVQAQTQTVWNQATSHKIPNLFFINKLDRKLSSVTNSMNSITPRLPRSNPVLIQLPIYSSQHQLFSGIIDVISLRTYNWDVESHSSGNSNPILTDYTSAQLSDSDPMFPDVIKTRMNLLEHLANSEDGLLREEFLKLQNPSLLIPAKLIEESLRKAVIATHVSPVLIGSAKQNIGVTHLLNRIIDFLPDPTEKQCHPSTAPSWNSSSTNNSSNDSLGATTTTSYFHHFLSLIHHPDHLSGLVFKLIHDPIRGPIVFMRLYSGFIHNSDVVRNLTRGTKEKVQKIMQMTGDSFSELTSASTGDIVAISGLKTVYTGDFLVGVDMPISANEENEEYIGLEGNNERLIAVPKPVIHAAVEVHSPSDIKKLEAALDMLIKEDPSLSYHRDPETHQTIIGGMGRLHLEIVFNRIRDQFKLPRLRLGKVRILYKECLYVEQEEEERMEDEEASEIYKFVHENHVVGVNMELRCHSSDKFGNINKGKIIFKDTDEFKWSQFVNMTIRRKIDSTLSNGLDRLGPLLRSPIIGVDVVLKSILWDGEIMTHFKDSRTQTAKTKTHFKLVQTALLECLRELCARQQHTAVLMEPIMKLVVHINHTGDREVSQYLSSILSDLYQKRRATNMNMSQLNDGDSTSAADQSQFNNLTAFIPLVEAIDYSEVIRQLSSGHAGVHMEFSHYQPMGKEEQERIIDKKMLRRY